MLDASIGPADYSNVTYYTCVFVKLINEYLQSNVPGLRNRDQT